MTVARLVLRRLIMGVVVLGFLVLGWAPVRGDGLGIEPPLQANKKYDPPPYLGTLTFHWTGTCEMGGWTYEGCVFVSGSLQRAGGKEDVTVFGDVILQWSVPEVEFQSHTAKTIRSLDTDQDGQLESRVIDVSGLGIDGLPAYLEVMGAHSLIYSPDRTQFTVDVILMPLAIGSSSQ
jgi:hypothetical protein